MSSYADASSTGPESRQSSARRRGSRQGAERGPRRGAKRTLMGVIRELPNWLRMFLGLFRDPRVSTIDKVLVGAAIAYLLAPVDLIPDVIPFLGQVDDVFLLVTALRRLMQNAGRRVILDHWSGDLKDLSELNLERVIAAAAFFLPGRMRRRLKMIGRV